MSNVRFSNYSIYSGDWGDKYKESEKPKELVCECGAEKTYGAKATRLHHALWCPMRGDVDNEID